MVKENGGQSKVSVLLSPTLQPSVSIDQPPPVVSQTGSRRLGGRVTRSIILTPKIGPKGSGEVE